MMNHETERKREGETAASKHVSRIRKTAGRSDTNASFLYGEPHAIIVTVVRLADRFFEH